TPDKTRSADSRGAGGDSRAARRARRSSGPSSSSASTPAPPSGAGDDFSTALAQSLGAAPADGTVPARTGAAKGHTEPGADEPSDHSARHSAADPVSNALTLLEHSLAGALLGGPPAPAAASPATTSAGGSPVQGGHSAVATKGTASVINTLLGQSLAADAKASGSSQTLTAASDAATPAATASASSAALAAAQLAAGAHVGAQQPKADSMAMTLSSPVGSSAWTDELGAKVTWLAHQGIESASLQLSPEHLGPLQVSISVHNGQASVWFGAAQPDTRTALQQSLPQLRQLFAGNGLTLADAGVSREPPRGQGRQQSARQSAMAAVGAVSLDSSASRGPVVGGLGLVDIYA
ncbi:MAG TPA: flagellar hook-length control protein FliK, partial [Steroidobacteraceae bacterium]|nr:flagellar hook-length control protein FliK [Steroidobacteraceae bacterium]